MISEEEFLLARKDTNNIRIIKKAISQYFKWFSQQDFPHLIDFPQYDELKALGDIALWKALSSFNKDKKYKFTSWLFKITLQQLSNDVRSRYSGQVYSSIQGGCDRIVFDENVLEDSEYLDGYLRRLGSVDSKIMKLRLFDKLTLNEISQQVKLSRECVRKRIKKNMGLLRKALIEAI